MPHVDGMPLGHPVWIELSTSDPDASRTFYESLLGWKGDGGDPDLGGYISLTLDGTVVAGAMGKDHMPDGGAGVPDQWSVYLHSADTAATLELATQHGGTVLVGPFEVPGMGVMGFVQDPTGAAVGVWQPLAHHGFGVVAEPHAPGWFELFTRDFRASLGFYETVFGWNAVVVGDSDEFRYATLEADEAAAAGVMDASGFLPDGVPDHWSVYFAVPETAAAIEKATGLGATAVQGPDATPFGNLATLTDPTGAVFKLTDGGATPQ